MNRLIFLTVLFFTSSNTALAACLWGYTNALTTEITSAQTLLTDYSTCRGDCRTLEADLKRNVTRMAGASSCSTDIYSRSNKELIDFIAGRFKLIQKQKQSWSVAAAAKSVKAPTQPVLLMEKVAFVPPEPVKPMTEIKSMQASKAVKPAPQPKQVVKQTMTVSQKSWQAPRANRKMPQRISIRKPVVNHQASRQRQLAQQRLIQQRKQAIIKQKQLQLLRAKKIAMQNHLKQQRLKQQRLLKRRELVRQLNRKRIQQRKAAWAKRRQSN